MKYTHIVWDWNGTLFDDFGLCLSSINTLLARHGLPVLTAGQYRSVFGFPVSDYYKRIGFDFDKIPFSVLAVEYMEIYQPQSYFCALRKGAQDVLDELNLEGYLNVVLSASRLDYLKKQMIYAGISNVDAVYGIDDIHAAGKEELARRLRCDYPQGRFLFIGDTPHDAAAAEAAQADCLLLAGGHKPLEELARFGEVIEDICILPKWIKSKMEADSD